MTAIPGTGSFRKLLRNMRLGTTQRKSGFEDVPRQDRCCDPSHNPPSHMVIPAGKQYRHVCPGCHKETVIRSNEVWC